MSYWVRKTFFEDLNFRGQRVLTRVDFNVPLDAKQRVTDNTGSGRRCPPSAALWSRVVVLC